MPYPVNRPHHLLPNDVVSGAFVLTPLLFSQPAFLGDQVLGYRGTLRCPVIALVVAVHSDTSSLLGSSPTPAPQAPSCLLRGAGRHGVDVLAL